MTTTRPHLWKGQEITTAGQLFNALAALESEEEGARFMANYFRVLATSDDPAVAANPVGVAATNVGYVANYGDPETARRIHTYTRSAHPFFGLAADAPPIPPEVLAERQRILDLIEKWVGPGGLNDAPWYPNMLREIREGVTR